MAFFRHDGSSVRCDADAQVNHISLLQSSRTATADYFTLCQIQRFDPVYRFFHITAEGRLIINAFCLPTGIRTGCLDDIIHQDPGNLYILRMQRSCLGDVFHLHDHDTAAMLHRLCDRQCFTEHGFMFKGHIAVGISSRSPQDCHIYGEGFVEQILFSFKFDQLADIFLSDLVHTAAVQSGINESSESDFGDQSRSSCRNFPPQVYDHALGQAPAFQFVFHRQLIEGKCASNMSCAPFGHQPFPGFPKPGNASGFPVAHGASLFHVQIAGMPCFFIIVPDRASDLLCPSGQSHAAARNCGTIRDQLRRFLCSDNLCHNLLLIFELTVTVLV